MNARDLRAYAVAALLTLAGVFALSMAASTDVAAQSTGGSFGGGDFGSGGSSDRERGRSDWGSSGSDWGSRRGSDWGRDWGAGSSSSGPGGYAPSASPAPLSGSCVCCILVLVGLLLLGMSLLGRKMGFGPPPGGAGSGGYVGPNAMYVTSVSLGLDWRARAQLQAHLDRLARTGDTRSPQGLAQLLSETVLALRRHEMSWLYAAYRDEGAHTPQGAQQAFSRLAQDYRARFQAELVRGAAGQVQTQSAPSLSASATEGEGTVVVTIVLATRRPMQGFQTRDAGAIRNALADRGALQASEMVALEVIWSPAAENDRMSTAELESVYPELGLIDPNSIAGRIFCAYCNGPFAAELLNCPHCGAPADASRSRRSPRG